MLLPGGQIGEIVDKGKVKEKQYQTIDSDTLEYCWRHPITLTSDWKNPNEKDKKQLEKIRLVPREIVEKDGTVKRFRICPKCWQMVEYTKEPK